MHISVLHQMSAKADAAFTYQLWPGWPDECALGALQNVKRIAQRANARHAPRVPHKLASRLHLLPAHTMSQLGGCSARLRRALAYCSSLVCYRLQCIMPNIQVHPY